MRTANAKIRVMLMDDHTLFREPLAFMFELEPDITVVAQAESLSDARGRLKDTDLAVDVAIVDLGLPDGSGIDFINDLHEARKETRALVLSAYSEPLRLAHAIEAGAAAIMHKYAPFGEIVDVVRRLHAGEQLLSQQKIEQAHSLVAREREERGQAQLRIGRLTSDECEVLRALVEGRSDEEISDKLDVDAGTVHTTVAHILKKLEVQTRLRAVVFAVGHGIVEVDSPSVTLSSQIGAENTQNRRGVW